MTVTKGCHRKVAIERRGIFSADNFNSQFSHFLEVKNKTTQASDHAAVWARFNI